MKMGKTWNALKTNDGWPWNKMKNTKQASHYLVLIFDDAQNKDCKPQEKEVSYHKWCSICVSNTCFISTTNISDT